jgi:hypothetical protein
VWRRETFDGVESLPVWRRETVHGVESLPWPAGWHCERARRWKRGLARPSHFRAVLGHVNDARRSARRCLRQRCFGACGPSASLTRPALRAVRRASSRFGARANKESRRCCVFTT